MSQLSTNRIFQNAWVVADFDQALQWWTQSMGVGPFYFMDFESPATLTYRGNPGTLKMRVAWAQAGDVQVELIEPRSDSPNVYRDLVPAGETRFHHVCFWSDDLDADVAALEARNYPLAMHSGPSPAGARFAYLDSSATNGHMIELLEHHEGIAGMFAGIRAAGADWDGKRPLREFTELLS